MKVAVVGAGLIGGRRARVASSHPTTTLALVIDIDRERASRLGRELDCEPGTDWRAAVDRADIDCVVVATPNNLLAPVSSAALLKGKHVLCEKPMATEIGDAMRMVEAAVVSEASLAVGYTLRHHPAIAKAKELLDSGAIGAPLYARACYGHGGRPGYEKEWRFIPEVSGGGELIDQGVHLIDLSRWFLGDFSEVSGTVSTSCWDVAPLEDNAFFTMRGAGGTVAHLHASCTQWKNKFSFELFGSGGYLVVEGLGGSYGTETLILGVRDAENPPPGEETFTFEDDGGAWWREWMSFIDLTSSRPAAIASGDDGLAALRLARAVYTSSKEGRAVPVESARAIRKGV